MHDDSRNAAAVTIVVITFNRREEIVRTLQRLVALPEHPPIVVVDNGSSDGTAAAIAQAFPCVNVLPLEANIGAAARNHGVDAARTRYVAFCDDDTWWEPGALAQATRILDASPTVAVLCARVLVGIEGRVDPVSLTMARSPLGSAGLPGRALIGFMAGASVMRVDAFREVGGYCAQLFIGGEEQLLALDLAARGHHLCYCDALTVRHIPSRVRDARGRRALLARNAIWIAWMRLPALRAWRVMLDHAASPALRGQRIRVLSATLTGLRWALRNRRVIPHDVACMLRRVEDVRRTCHVGDAHAAHRGAALSVRKVRS